MNTRIATIDGVGFGLRDFPNGLPGLWFGVNWDGGFGALLCFQGEQVTRLIIDEKIHDVFDLNGKQCYISVKDNIVSFLQLVHGNEVLAGQTMMIGE